MHPPIDTIQGTRNMNHGIHLFQIQARLPCQRQLGQSPTYPGSPAQNGSCQDHSCHGMAIMFLLETGPLRGVSDMSTSQALGAFGFATPATTATDAPAV